MTVAGSSVKAAVGFGLLLSLTAAGAQEPRQDIYARCAQIADDRERLACFDSTYANERAIMAERAETERKVEADGFGLTPKQLRERDDRAVASPLSAPAGALANANAPAAAPGTAATGTSESTGPAPTALANAASDIKVVSIVTEVLTDGLGNHVIILENGQMWRSTSNKSFRGRVKAGWKAEVTKVWSGGYRMTFTDKTGFLGVSRMR